MKRFSTFMSGSAIGAIIDYLVTVTCVDVLEIQPVIALGLAMFISGSTVFLFHTFVTFLKTEASLGRRYLFFLSWSLIVFSLRAFCMQLFFYIGLSLYLALTLAILLVSIINYQFSSKIIFVKVRAE